MHLTLLLWNMVVVTRSAFLTNPLVLLPLLLPMPDSKLRQATQAFRDQVSQQVQKDPSIAGPLIRLAFHDAATFEYSPKTLTKPKMVTGGANGSIRYEIERSENRGMGRSLGLLENIYDQGGYQSIFSIADAIALLGAVAVEASGGPVIPVRMGRGDQDYADPEYLRLPVKKATSRSKVEKTLPSAGLDSVGLRLYFGRLGLSEAEFVALSGSHGLGRHVSLLGMPKPCLKNLTRTCLENAPVLLPFVTNSVDKFDNSYFSALLRWNENQVELGEVAFIPTDVDLVVDQGLRRHVQRFAKDQDDFFRVYTNAYQKLVETTATSSQRY
jgi:catalase (peroxidase I)